MPPPAQGTHSTTTSRPLQSASTPSQSAPRPTSPASSASPASQSRGATASPPASSSSSSSSTPAQAPAQTVAPSTTSSRAHSTRSLPTTSLATPTTVVAASSSKPVPTTTIAAASAAAAALVLALIAWQVYRCRRRKSPVPPPRPFSTWVNDRYARSTVYDTTEADPYAISSLYALRNASAPQSQTSSAKASPTWEAPAFLTLPMHGRDFTSDTSSSIQRSGTPSTGISAHPLLSPSSGLSSAGSDGVLDPPAPFMAALSHQSSRGSLSSSRDSTASFAYEGSSRSTPPPMEHASPIMGSSRAPSVHSTTRSARRASAARPVSYAPTVGSRHSIYSVSASTIRGAPHQPHNRVDIVLPAPLAPESFMPVAPFMASHSRTGSDRSRRTSLQSWRDDSPSREGSMTGREDDVLSLRSQRSVATIPYQSMPPVPPLPASVVRSASPLRSSRSSESPAPTRPSTGTTVSSAHSAPGLSTSLSPRVVAPLSPVPGSPSARSITSFSEYGTPLSSPQPSELMTPRILSLHTLQPKISLEQLAAAAVDTLLSDMGPHQRA